MSWKHSLAVTSAVACFATLCVLSMQRSTAQGIGTLRPASAFETIADERERSLALFEEAGKVIQHPRCMNCHPATERPTQTMTMRPHQPPVFRGDGGMGLPGMQCTTCHGAENTAIPGQTGAIRSIPGKPTWHLAPVEMAWAGRTLGQICEQLKDPSRNGNKTMDEIIEHMAKDDLVGWGWHPGPGREPARYARPLDVTGFRIGQVPDRARSAELRVLRQACCRIP